MSFKDIYTEIKIAKPLAPVLFIGHGNPLNAITDNIYRDDWRELGEILPRPKAILCISAHWLTSGTYVTMSDHPRTIHDFGGFPQELFEVQYPAPGATKIAQAIIDHIRTTKIQEDHKWGLDHGTWSVLMNMYPQADIPVLQMSLDVKKDLEEHYQLAKELAFLRKEGVLIVSSGNVVHNLGKVDWDNETKPYDWALQFDEFVAKSIIDQNDPVLIDYLDLGTIAQLAQPTNDHYLPLIYTIGLRESDDALYFFNESIDMCSIGMRSMIFY